MTIASLISSLSYLCAELCKIVYHQLFLETINQWNSDLSGLQMSAIFRKFNFCATPANHFRLHRATRNVLHGVGSRTLPGYPPVPWRHGPLSGAAWMNLTWADSVATSYRLHQSSMFPLMRWSLVNKHIEDDELEIPKTANDKKMGKLKKVRNW